MKVGIWSQKANYINYVWQSSHNTKKQQACLYSPLMCEDRGNYQTAYDVYSSIDYIKYLNNYYFIYEIAKNEVETWAEVIEQTIDCSLSGIDVDPIKTTVKNNDYFITLIAPIKLIFDNNQSVSLWRFDVQLKSNIFSIDCNDLFPRYYTKEPFAYLEENNWIDIWMKKYLKTEKN